MSINRALGQRGAGHDVTDADGKTWTMLPLSELNYAQLEKWMIRRAWSLYRLTEDVLEADERQQLWDETRRDIEAGVYSLDQNFGPDLDKDGKPKLDPKTGLPSEKRVPTKMLGTTEATIEITRLFFVTRHPDITTAQTVELMAVAGDQIQEGMISIGEAALKNRQRPPGPVGATASSPAR